LGELTVALEIAQVIVEIFEAYALTGLGFAMLFLPRAVVHLDPRVAGAAKTLRLLILPGVVALWPLFAWRWFSRSGEPVERNPHRAKARELVRVGAPRSTRELAR
jgi:hypothetical protein